MSIALVMALFELLERAPELKPILMRILWKLQRQSIGSRVGNLMRLERLLQRLRDGELAEFEADMATK